MRDEPRKLSNQPLTLVLAEFRFSDVLRIEGHIPDIQEKIRKQYPVLKKSDHQTVQLADQAIKVHSTSQWLFTSTDQRSTVIIGHDRLVYITSDYDRFPEFCDRCFSTLEVIKEVVDPTLLLRIGLRYNDHIVTDNPDQLAKCVDPQLLPNPKFNSLGPAINHHRIDTSVQTSAGSLSIRSLFGKHGLIVMPDLSQALPVELKDPHGSPEASLLLDFDHSWTAKDPGIPFELELAKEHLDSLHLTARQAFWQVTTEYARSNLWS